jgi:HK97 gp10 family phage protein
MADFNHWQDLADALPDILSQVVRKTAFDIAADAAQAAPVDTGFLRNSIYVATWDTSTYARGGYGDGHQELLPEVDVPEDETTAYVAVGASYGVYLEFGTRFMNAQPYFFPAMERGGDAFDAAMEKIEAKLAKVAGG